jgi:hypothetical protein
MANRRRLISEVNDLLRRTRAAMLDAGEDERFGGVADDLKAAHAALTGAKVQLQEAVTARIGGSRRG